MAENETSAKVETVRPRRGRSAKGRLQPVLRTHFRFVDRRTGVIQPFGADQGGVYRVGCSSNDKRVASELEAAGLIEYVEPPSGHVKPADLPADVTDTGD